jgi:hypothetical protein
MALSTNVVEVILHMVGINYSFEIGLMAGIAI